MRLVRTIALVFTVVACASINGAAQAPRAQLLPPVPVAPLVVGTLTSKDDRSQQMPYRPQPGDLLLYDDFRPLYHLAFKISRTKPPTHAAMVIADREGRPMLLELTGPTLVSSKVMILDPDTRLHSYPGEILVRRIKQPLTPEQSQELTRFAYAQEGKRFAFPRVLLQGTPFCARVGLRRWLFGKTYFDRDRWFCSEMVVAAGCKAQIFDPERLLANATLPRDLAFDETIDLSSVYHSAILWTPHRSER